MAGDGTAPLYRILGLLERQKKTAGGYEASCPCSRHAKGDRHPSLSISMGSDSRVLLNCHGGCDTSDILTALGLEWSDLFEKSPAGNPVRRFRLNSNGSAYAHGREDLPGGDKKVWWEHDGKKGLNGTAVVDLPLYRSDQLGSDLTRPVIVTEGEKAAQALADHDILAVATVTGADKTPSDSVLSVLEGREVWLWPDNDDIGRTHMKNIAARLHGSVRWISWPNAPPKGDAADYIAAGGRFDGIAGMLVATSPPRADGPTIWRASDLMSMRFDAVRWAIPGLLPAGLAILAGRPKLGKSWLGLGWALDVARGVPVLKKMEVVRGETLYLALEDGFQRMQERLAMMLGDNLAPDEMNVVCDWPRVDEGGLELLEQWLTDHPKARLVVVDTFKKVRPKEKGNARLYDLDYDAIAPMADLARRFNVAIVVVFHTRKGESSDPLEMVSGTLGLSGAADCVLVLRRERGQADASLFVTGRDVEEQDLALRLDKEDELGWVLLGNADQFRRSKERSDILAAIDTMPGMSPSEIADAIGKARGAVRYLLFAMVRDAEVRVREGKYYPLEKIMRTQTNANSPNAHRESTDQALTGSRGTQGSAIGAVPSIGSISGVRAQCSECRTRDLLPHETTGVCSVCINKDKPDS